MSNEIKYARQVPQMRLLVWRAQPLNKKLISGFREATCCSCVYIIFAKPFRGIIWSFSERLVSAIEQTCFRAFRFRNSYFFTFNAVIKCFTQKNMQKYILAIWIQWRSWNHFVFTQNLPADIIVIFAWVCKYLRKISANCNFSTVDDVATYTFNHDRPNRLATSTLAIEFQSDFRHR